MAKPSSATRAPRGTKSLAKAFFAAADEIPQPQRAEVVKAALALIRDELKAAREKLAAAKAKAKEKTGKASASPVRKPADVAKAPTTVQVKVLARRARKAASESAESTTPDEPAKAAAEPNS
jgi:hypothetical protein